jgi:uncharacterized protein
MTKAIQFTDVMEPMETTSRTITKDGYLTASAVLAKAGVFNYRADELGLKNRKPDEMVAVYRSTDALAKSVESFEAQPIALDHKWITSANWRSNAIGDVRDVEMHGDGMVGTLIVRDAAGIKAVQGGKTQLSNGYHATIVHRPGTYEGKAYEYEQTNFLGNHIALVDAARCGSECRIQDEDSSRQKELFMITRNFDGLTLTFDNPQSGEVFDRMARALEDARKEVADLKGETAKAKELFDCKCQELEAVKKEAITPEEIQRMVVERSKVMTEAKELVPDLKVGDKQTAHDIRMDALHTVCLKDEAAREMWNEAFGDRKPESITPQETAVAFSTIVAGLRKAKNARKVADSRLQVGRVADATYTGPEKDARELAMERQANAWKSTKTEVN